MCELCVASEMYTNQAVRLCMSVCVFVCPGTKESGGSSVAGREQINAHRARMLPHSPRQEGTGVYVCVCLCVWFCVYNLAK